MFFRKISSILEKSVILKEEFPGSKSLCSVFGKNTLRSFAGLLLEMKGEGALNGEDISETD